MARLTIQKKNIQMLRIKNILPVFILLLLVNYFFYEFKMIFKVNFLPKSALYFQGQVGNASFVVPVNPPGVNISSK